MEVIKEIKEEPGLSEPSLPEVVTTRVKIPETDSTPSLETMMDLWQKQQGYIDHLESKVKKNDSESKDINNEASRREHLLVVRLATKEQELQELSNQIAELKAAQAPSTSAMRNALLDPAVNIIVSKLTQELDATKSKLSQVNEEMSAWKFTPDSVTGKRLMARCRQLLQENEDIAKMVSSGRLAKLEGELAMHKKLVEEMKKNQVETDDFVQELDEDMEGMQSTIYLLQQQLKESKEQVTSLQSQLKESQETAAAVVREAASAVTAANAAAAPPHTADDPEEEEGGEGMDDDNEPETPTKRVGKRASAPAPDSPAPPSGRRGRSAAAKKTPSKDDGDDESSRPKRRRAVPQRGGGGGKKTGKKTAAAASAEKDTTEESDEDK